MKCKEKIRIVQINGGAKGSTGKIMMEIAKAAKEYGYEVMCASPITSTNRDANKDCGYYRIGTFYSRRINVLLSRVTGFNGCFAWIETYKLLKAISKFKPDIIQLHNLHDSYINLPMLFKYIKKKDIPIVWTLHDCWAFTGQCPYFTIVKCEKWKLGCNNCPQYREYPSSLYDNTKTMWKMKKKWFSNIKNLEIVTPSQWLADLVQQSYLKEYPVKVIHNGIDLNVFKPTEGEFRKKYGIKENQYIVLGVSFAWGYRKGLDCFIELAKILDEDYKIVLVGTDEKIDEQLPANILSIHRTQNQKELAEIYTAADVFVMPTREENYPTVNLEAVACGTPVITFKTGGSPETINEIVGETLEQDSIEMLCSAIKYWVDRNLKNACVSYAMKHYDAADKYRDYLNLYFERIEHNVE